ncbi:MAG: hypothetical protein R3D05_06395 [Dongiaceae bacterium]
MKFGVLKSIGHNVADSLASGVGLMIGIQFTDIFAETAAGSEGFIEVDFLTGAVLAGKPSQDLSLALKRYAEALPELCKRQGADVSEFRQLGARFFGRHGSHCFTVTIEDRHGRRSTDEYVGLPGKRPKVLDHLGRVRRT